MNATIETMAVNNAAIQAHNENNDDEIVERVTFGQALRFYRGRAGLTQSELAERANMRVTTLSGWEKFGEPPLACVRLPAA